MGTLSSDDRLAITDLTIAYCWALDTHQWDDLDGVFTTDAVALLGTECHGLDAIKERVSGALSPLDDSQHMVTNHQITVDGAVGTSRCYLHAQHVRSAAAGGPNFVVAGRYEDRLVRTADGWRIAHRNLITMWTDGNPVVVRGDA
jgi:hypothetical protein